MPLNKLFQRVFNSCHRIPCSGPEQEALHHHTIPECTTLCSQPQGHGVGSFKLKKEQKKKAEDKESEDEGNRNDEEKQLVNHVTDSCAPLFAPLCEEEYIEEDLIGPDDDEDAPQITGEEETSEEGSQPNDQDDTDCQTETSQQSSSQPEVGPENQESSNQQGKDSNGNVESGTSSPTEGPAEPPPPYLANPPPYNPALVDPASREPPPPYSSTDNLLDSPGTSRPHAGRTRNRRNRQRQEGRTSSRGGNLLQQVLSRDRNATSDTGSFGFGSSADMVRRHIALAPSLTPPAPSSSNRRRRENGNRRGGERTRRDGNLHRNSTGDIEEQDNRNASAERAVRPKSVCSDEGPMPTGSGEMRLMPTAWTGTAQPSIQPITLSSTQPSTQPESSTGSNRRNRNSASSSSNSRRSQLQELAYEFSLTQNSYRKLALVMEIYRLKNEGNDVNK